LLFLTLSLTLLVVNLHERMNAQCISLALCRAVESHPEEHGDPRSDEFLFLTQSRDDIQ
jgi:hypothetical protein